MDLFAVMRPHNAATRNKLLRLIQTPCVDGTALPTNIEMEVRLPTGPTSTEGVIVSPLIEEARDCFVSQLGEGDVVRILFVFQSVAVSPMFFVLAVHKDGLYDIPVFCFRDDETVSDALEEALASTELQLHDFARQGQIYDDYGTKYLVYQYNENIAPAMLSTRPGHMAWLFPSEILNNGHLAGIPIAPKLVELFCRKDRAQLLVNGEKLEAPAVMYAVPVTSRNRRQILYDYDTSRLRSAIPQTLERCLIFMGIASLGQHTQLKEYDTVAVVSSEGRTSVVIGDAARVIGLEYFVTS